MCFVKETRWCCEPGKARVNSPVELALKTSVSRVKG